jgi:hypothetical protein
VDWDGDGKKDFIACEFELDCRFFRNTSPGRRASARASILRRKAS